MTTTFADLAARVRGVESRSERNEEDITAIMDTVSETLTRVERVEGHVQRLDQRLEGVEGRLERVEGRLERVERGVTAIATHLGVVVPATDEDPN